MGGKIVNLAKLCQEFFGETANNLSITTGFIPIVILTWCI